MSSLAQVGTKIAAGIKRVHALYSCVLKQY